MSSAFLPGENVLTNLGFQLRFDESRPGQLSIGAVQSMVGHLSGIPQRLFGVVGSDVSRSLSPVMHSAAYRTNGLFHLFIPLSVPDPEELALVFTHQGKDLFAAVGITTGGWAVTTPYKRQAAEAATRCAPRVRRAGVANTLLLKPDEIIAENTDADGVVGALRSIDVDPCGATAVVQGTGGAARGAAVGLHLAGATVFIRGRDSSRTRAVAEHIDLQWCDPGEAPPRPQILVNATPLGGAPEDPCPFSEDEIEAATVVLDMVYADRPTRLLTLAGDAGTAVVDGRDVLAHQGYAQFAAFTGTLPPKEAMRAALDRMPK